MSNINNILEYIVEESNAPESFILQCEEKYNNKINKIAQQIHEKSVSEIVMIAGPSSAGKTTTAKKLGKALAELGINSYTVSLDDFYLDNKDAPRFPDGTPDFETVECLDIKCFQEKMQELLDKGETELPEFDFLKGQRKPEYKKIKIKDSDVIIVEGLHALNPIITSALPKDRLLKIYINVSSRIYDEKGNIILNKRNMRFVRRLVRDYKYRGSSVEKTFKLWITVRYGEDTYLFPFKDNADVKINTIHLYESCVLKEQAIELLSTLDKESEFYNESQRLVRSLQKFPVIDSSLVPEDSLLREFIGAKES